MTRPEGPVCVVCETRGPYDSSFQTGRAMDPGWCCSKKCVATLAQMRAVGPQLPIAATSLQRLPGEIVLRLASERLAGPWRVEPLRGHPTGWLVQHADTSEVVPCKSIVHAGNVCERLNAWEATRGL